MAPKWGKKSESPRPGTEAEGDTQAQSEGKSTKSWGKKSESPRPGTLAPPEAESDRQATGGGKSKAWGKKSESPGPPPLPPPEPEADTPTPRKAWGKKSESPRPAAPADAEGDGKAPAPRERKAWGKKSESPRPAEGGGPAPAPGENNAWGKKAESLAPPEAGADAQGSGERKKSPGWGKKSMTPRSDTPSFAGAEGETKDSAESGPSKSWGRKSPKTGAQPADADDPSAEAAGTSAPESGQAAPAVKSGWGKKVPATEVGDSQPAAADRPAPDTKASPRPSWNRKKAAEGTDAPAVSSQSPPRTSWNKKKNLDPAAEATDAPVASSQSPPRPAWNKKKNLDPAGADAPTASSQSSPRPSWNKKKNLDPEATDAPAASSQSPSLDPEGTDAPAAGSQSPSRPSWNKEKDLDAEGADAPAASSQSPSRPSWNRKKNLDAEGADAPAATSISPSRPSWNKKKDVAADAVELARICPGGCGYQITWHETHCCGRCEFEEGHGERCEKKPMPAKASPRGWRTTSSPSSPRGAGTKQAAQESAGAAVSPRTSKWNKAPSADVSLVSGKAPVSPRGWRTAEKPEDPSADADAPRSPRINIVPPGKQRAVTEDLGESPAKLEWYDPVSRSMRTTLPGGSLVSRVSTAMRSDEDSKASMRSDESDAPAPKASRKSWSDRLKDAANDLEPGPPPESERPRKRPSTTSIEGFTPRGGASPRAPFGKTSAGPTGLKNDEGASISYGTDRECTAFFYCGRNWCNAPDGSDGICGPTGGPQCPACERASSGLKNDEGAMVSCGTESGYTESFYCGRLLGRDAIPGSDGRCGPNRGTSCASCQRFQANSLVGLKNDESAMVSCGTSNGCTDSFYCGRLLGKDAIPGSRDGRCGPSGGPQCASCDRFQAMKALKNDEGARLSCGTDVYNTGNYYCGRNLGKDAIPGSSDGRCGPNRGSQCFSCERFQVSRGLKNEDGAKVTFGTEQGYADIFYCGRVLGRDAIPGSDGRCGPNRGPQCTSCERFQFYQAIANVSGSWKIMCAEVEELSKGVEFTYQFTASTNGFVIGQSKPTSSSVWENTLKGSLRGDEVSWAEFSLEDGAKVGEYSAKVNQGGKLLSGEGRSTEGVAKFLRFTGVKVAQTTAPSSMQSSPRGWMGEDADGVRRDASKSPRQAAGISPRQADGISPRQDAGSSGRQVVLSPRPSPREGRTDNDDEVQKMRAADGGADGTTMPDEQSSASRVPPAKKMKSAVAQGFLAAKRWEDLQQMLRWEKTQFYDKVVRCDMTDVLQTMSEEDINTIRSYASPPSLMLMVLSNVFILLGLPDDWASMKRNLRPFASFKETLQAFQYTDIRLKQLQYMRRRLKKCPAAFSPDVVATISSACACLCRWVNVMCWRAGEQSWFHADVELLKDIDKETISCLASFARPPPMVAEVMGNVHFLLGLDDQWQQIQTNLKAPSAFMQRLQYFDQTTLTEATLEAMKQRQALYPHSFCPDVVTGVNASCALFSKWVNAVCLRAGLDFSSTTAGPRGHRCTAGCHAFQSAAMKEAYVESIRGGLSPRLITQSIHEEMPGWSQRVPIDKKFIRPEGLAREKNKTMEQMIKSMDRSSLLSGVDRTALRWQARVAKCFLDPSGKQQQSDLERTRSPRSFQEDDPNEYGETLRMQNIIGGSSVSPAPASRDVLDMGSSRSPFKAQQITRPPQASSRPSRASSRPASGSVSAPRASSQPLTDKRGSQLSIPLRSKNGNSGQRAQTPPSAQKPEQRSYPGAGNQKPGNARQASRSPGPGSRSAVPAANARQSPSKVGGSAPATYFPDDDLGVRHPDSHLLSSLEGPAVIATVAGVLRKAPKNPELVAFVLGNVHSLLGLDPAWESVLESLNSFEQFMMKLRFLDQAIIKRPQLDVMRKRQQERPESFMPDKLMQTSVACSKFAAWVNAVLSRAGLEW